MPQGRVKRKRPQMYPNGITPCKPGIIANRILETNNILYRLATLLEKYIELNYLTRML